MEEGRRKKEEGRRKQWFPSSPGSAWERIFRGSASLFAVFPHLGTNFLGSARGYFSISSIDQSASNRLNSRMFVIIGSHV